MQLASVPIFPHCGGLEVHFTTEQEAQLAQIATQTGTDAEHLVRDAVWCLRVIGSLHRRDIHHVSVERGIVDANVLVYALNADAHSI